MKKYIDILLFTLLFFLLFSFFTWKNTEAPLSGIIFQTTKTSYKVPAWVELNIVNNTLETLSLDTCEDISLRFAGSIIEIPENLCVEEELISRQSKKIDFSEYYNLFENPGNYTFELELWDQKYVEQLEVSYRWSIGKLFTGFLYAPVYNMLAYLIQLFSSSLWWAIVVLTIIVRIILLFPQHKMMVGQRKMQAIQPKVKKLQEKHKGNQQVLWMELMKLYKQEGVNPMGSCWFLLIQMPILIVIYNIIINITSPVNQFYLYESLASFQVSQINYNFFGIDLLAAGGAAWVVLALTVGIIQFIQVKLSLIWRETDSSSGVVLEKKKWEDSYNPMMPDPEMMNKFMLYGMPAMVAVFTYTLIAGVGIYWWVSTLFAIFQQIFVNKIIKK